MFPALLERRPGLLPYHGLVCRLLRSRRRLVPRAARHGRASVRGRRGLQRNHQRGHERGLRRHAGRGGGRRTGRRAAARRSRPASQPSAVLAAIHPSPSRSARSPARSSGSWGFRRCMTCGPAMPRRLSGSAGPARAVVDKAQSDPLWGRTFDFAYEAKSPRWPEAADPPTRRRRPDGRRRAATDRPPGDRRPLRALTRSHSTPRTGRCLRTASPARRRSSTQADAWRGSMRSSAARGEPWSRWTRPAPARQPSSPRSTVTTARSTCYFRRSMCAPGTPGGDTYIIAGSYTDTLARTPSGWKIAETRPGLPVARRQPRRRQPLTSSPARRRGFQLLTPVKEASR